MCVNQASSGIRQHAGVHSHVHQRNISYGVVADYVTNRSQVRQASGADEMLQACCTQSQFEQRLVSCVADLGRHLEQNL